MRVNALALASFAKKLPGLAASLLLYLKLRDSV